MKFRLIYAAVLAGLVAGSVSVEANAATITFDNASGSLTSYSESGFTTTTIAGFFNVNTLSGNPAPSIYTEGSIGSTLQITRNAGGIFSFTGFDFSATDAAASYQIEGFLKGVNEFTQTGSAPDQGLGFHFMTVASGFSTPIDALTIKVTSGEDPNLDNISLAISAVPLPASAPMFGAALLGLAGLGYSAKRKKAASAA